MQNENQTKICKHCQTEIPKKAKICPNCRKKQGGIVKWIILGVVAFIIIVSIASGGDEKGTDSNPKKAGETQTTEKKEVDNKFVVGDIVEISNLKITYNSAAPYTSNNQFLQPKAGHTYYRVEFEFENTGDADEFVSSVDFECYADGYAMSETFLDVDDYLSTATISSGNKIKGAIYYEVPTDAKEIKLEYEANYFTSDKVIFIAK